MTETTYGAVRRPPHLAGRLLAAVATLLALPAVVWARPPRKCAQAPLSWRRGPYQGSLSCEFVGHTK